jgi:hypothetical protein
MSAYSQEVDVTGKTAYQAAPDVVVPFEPQSIAVAVISGTSAIAVSFDGINDDGHLVPGTPTAGVEFHQRVTQVWLRAEDGVALGAVAQVLAES